MVKAGVKYAVLEITSHGLSQNRFGNINFDYSVFTNITPEHLDYHETYESYLLSKAKLILKSKLTFINKDDSLSYEKLKKIAFENYKDIQEYSLSSLNKELVSQLRDVLKESYPGIYNQQNALAALIVFSRVMVKEITINDILLLKDLGPLEGRFNRINNKLGLNIIIDFAHTPNALENVLLEVCNLKKQSEKIISVFGCAGLRDTSKRFVMGQIAGKLADIVIVTAEDPRTEDVNDINKKIIKGIESVSGKYIIEIDRQKAIEKAVKMAQIGDWVVITGKGHEKSMCFGTIEVAWSDFESVNIALNSDSSNSSNSPPR